VLRSAQTTPRGRLAGLLVGLPSPEADALARLLDLLEGLTQRDAACAATAPPAPAAARGAAQSTASIPSSGTLVFRAWS
jgi:hypothetical protein